MTTAALNLGVIGCGVIAEEVHIPNIFAISECRLAAIADINNTRLNFIGDKFCIPEVDRYNNPEELYKRKDIKGVLVLTPAYTHKNFVIECTKSGKHVFVEKPMALDAKECQEMIHVAKKAKVKLAVGHYYSFLPTHQRVKRMLRRGKIGKAIAAQIHAETILIKPEEGQLLDFAPHFVDLLRWYFDDSRVESVFADISKVAGDCDTTKETEAYIIIKFANGVTGTLNLFWTPKWKSWEAGERFIRIIGTHGKLTSGLTKSSISIYNAKSLIGRVRGTYTIVPLFVSHPVVPITRTSFRKEIEDFIDAVRYDREPLISGEVGMEVMRIIDAARLSAQVGQIVEIKR